MVFEWNILETTTKKKIFLRRDVTGRVLKRNTRNDFHSFLKYKI